MYSPKYKAPFLLSLGIAPARPNNLPKDTPLSVCLPKCPPVSQKPSPHRSSCRSYRDFNQIVIIYRGLGIWVVVSVHLEFLISDPALDLYTLCLRQIIVGTWHEQSGRAKQICLRLGLCSPSCGDIPFGCRSGMDGIPVSAKLHFCGRI